MDMEVKCKANERLALFIREKKEKLALDQDFKKSVETRFNTACTNVCQFETPITSLKDAGKVKGIGPSMLKQLKEFFDEEEEEAAEGGEEGASDEPKGKKKAKRKYIPKKNSAAYALLLCLHRATLKGKSYMQKTQLIEAADKSGLSKTSFEATSDDNWYTGWKSMGILIKNRPVKKSSCPAKYSLTDEGIKVAETLES